MSSLAGSRFRIANYDLIDFYFGKKMHRRALELLWKFGHVETGEDSAPQLRGPKRTIAYLQHLSPEMIDLILEFAEWPLRVDPNLGMEISLADTERHESRPPPEIAPPLPGAITES
ncbi:Vacuolar sorting protein 39 domain 1 domain containing protein [Elaphomyces granulatus]